MKESTPCPVTCAPRPSCRSVSKWKRNPRWRDHHHHCSLYEQIEPMSEVRGKAERVHSRYLPAFSRSAIGGTAGPARCHRAAVPMRRCFLSPRNFHRALQRRYPGAVGAPDSATGLPRPSSRACPWRPSCRELCAPIDVAGEQRHFVESRSPARLSGIPPAYCNRDRRLGLEA